MNETSVPGHSLLYIHVAQSGWMEKKENQNNRTHKHINIHFYFYLKYKFL